MIDLLRDAVSMLCHQAMSAGAAEAKSARQHNRSSSPATLRPRPQDPSSGGAPRSASSSTLRLPMEKLLLLARLLAIDQVLLVISERWNELVASLT